MASAAQISCISSSGLSLTGVVLAGKALPASKDAKKGQSAPKGFGGGAAKPLRGRKKKAAAAPRKKSQAELLWELQKKQVLQ